MPRRPALLTQAEVARAVRGARQAGAHAVEIKRDGTIIVQLVPLSPNLTPAESESVDEERIVPL